MLETEQVANVTNYFQLKFTNLIKINHNVYVVALSEEQ